MTEQVEQKDAVIVEAGPVDGRAYYGQAARRRLLSDLYCLEENLGEFGMRLTAVIGTDDNPRWRSLLDQVATVHVALAAVRNDFRTEADDIPF